MDLRGAKIRDVYKLCADINEEDEKQLKVNIPHYQRPFKWDKEKIKLLIDDFFENYKNAIESEDYNIDKDKSYFAGSIVTVKKDGVNQSHDLIDGQQRITTVYLTNYVKFLLLRSYIYQLIYKKNQIKISEAFNDLVKAASNLYKSGYNELESIKKELVNEIEKASYEENEERYNDILSNYQKKLYMPLKNLDEESYNKAYKDKLNKFFGCKDLCLQYSRDSFNGKFKAALSSIKLELTSSTGPRMEIVDYEDCKQDDTIMQYIDAIERIFNSFFEYIDESKPALRKTDEMINKINYFLDYLNFCVVQTGNTNDAYTLFEVLNDRALELDDLDLIKNMFYKEYCQKNRNEDEEIINNNIEELENLWGDEIFSRNTSDWKKKLVSYLGTVFLTGSTRARHNQKAKYRKIIKRYLNDEYNDEYSFKDIKYEFQIFKAIKLIINNYDIPYQKKGRASLEAENNINHSITYKTLHLLNALKYFGVMSSLVNIILKTFIQDNRDEFDKDKFVDYINEIKNDKNNSVDKFEKIHQCAFQLWKLTMLADNYKKPRDFAKEIIENINYKNFSTNCLRIDIQMYSEVKDEFNKWTSRWYKSNKDDFRVKLLFLKLLQTKKSNNKIIYTQAKNVFEDVSKLELDHFEPSDPDDTHKEKYFIPGDMLGERSEYVNQLGNFMLLEKKENISLGNKPADKSFEAYEKMGLGIDDHWLVKELDELLEKYHVEKDGIDVRIPNEKFFNERKNRLQNYFYLILDMELNEKEKEIDF